MKTIVKEAALKNPNNPAYKKAMDNRANQLLILTTLDTRVSKK
ncbi:hypothetical protein Taitung16_01720 [Helicobacter pylori]